MSSRNRGPPIPVIGGPHGGLTQPHVLEPPFARGHRGGPHPPLHEDMREAHYSLSGPRQLPPHPVIIEERMAAQHDDIQALLVDNQRFAATHVALKQELEVTQYELQRADKYAQTLHAEKGLQMRELYEKSVKMENELQAVNAWKSELALVNTNIKEFTAVNQDLAAQIQMMTQDLGRITSDLQQVPAVKAETEGLRRELERVRAATEHEKKAFAESFEHGKVMENNLVTMARELEKLRAELANADKRTHAAAATVAAAAAVGNPGMSYNPTYVNPGNPFPFGYGTMPPNSVQPPAAGAESYPQYGSGPGPGPWGSFDANRAQGSR